jgi:serine/threonine protein phosphatase PrpC
MGTYLSTPVLDKCWEEGEDFSNSTPVAWGVVDMQGWRKTMEDAHIVQTDVRLPQSKSQIKAKAKTESEETQSQLQSESESTAEAESQPQQISTKDGEVQRVDHAQVFAVFDGHGGAEVARFCQLYLIDVLTRQAEWNGKESKTNDIGDGNADGNVDVGKALIKCFHGIDELIDNPNRR